jgi:hypothetical protein
MVSDDIAYCQQLGNKLVAAWSRAHFDIDRISAIAVDLLDQEEPSRHIDPGRVIEWLAHTPGVPYQPDVNSRFGEPAVTMFWHPLFRLDLLYWVDGTTAIHEHGFSGAFTLLAGSSVQSVFKFDVTNRINERLLLGNLRLAECQLLRPGHIEPILFGPQLIHSVFHLDKPSVTLVVRTNSLPRGGAQYQYLPPHVAIDPFFVDQTMKRKLAAFRFLRAVQPESSEATVSNALEQADFLACFQLLQQEFTLRHLNAERWCRLVDIIRRRFGEWSQMIETVYSEAERRDLIVALRKRVQVPEHRLFLALLLNVTDRKSLFRLIKERYPADEPSTLAAQWIVALAAQRALDIALASPQAETIASLLRSETYYLHGQQLDLRTETVKPELDTIENSLRESHVLQPLFVAANGEQMHFAH